MLRQEPAQLRTDHSERVTENKVEKAEPYRKARALRQLFFIPMGDRISSEISSQCRHWNSVLLRLSTRHLFYEAPVSGGRHWKRHVAPISQRTLDLPDIPYPPNEVMSETLIISPPTVPTSPYQEATSRPPE